MAFDLGDDVCALLRCGGLLLLLLFEFLFLLLLLLRACCCVCVCVELGILLGILILLGVLLEFCWEQQQFAAPSGKIAYLWRAAYRAD
jgi:hypothetical protein